MKRILFVVPRMNIGGAETYVFTVIKELHQRGYEVFLASGGGQLADKLSDMGIPTFFLPIRLSRPLSAWLLARIVKKHHIDLIHANSGAAGIVAAKVKRQLGIPVVYTAHGIFGNPEREYVIDELDTLICVSEYVKRDAIQRGFHESHLLVRYSGIDTDTFKPDSAVREKLRKQYGIDKDTLVLAVVSRIKNLQHKGHQYLLDVLSQYASKESWKLVVIGKGHGLPVLKGQVRQLGLSEKVICLGHRTDVAYCLQMADVLVLPSRFETFGLVLAEGMAMGKPAIAFDVGGTSEVIKDGETGFLVEKNNTQELYEKIKQLDEDRVLLSTFSTQGMHWVRERFTTKKMVDELEVIYKKLFY